MAYAASTSSLDADRPASTSVKRKGNAEATRLTLPTSTAAALRVWLDLRSDRVVSLWINFDRRAGSPQPLASEGLYLVKWLGAPAWSGAPSDHPSLRPRWRTRPVDRRGAPTSGHAAGGLDLLLVYRDQHEHRAGKVARWLAEAAPTPPR